MPQVHLELRSWDARWSREQLSPQGLPHSRAADEGPLADLQLCKLSYGKETELVWSGTFERVLGPALGFPRLRPSPVAFDTSMLTERDIARMFCFQEPTYDRVSRETYLEHRMLHTCWPSSTLRRG